MKCCAPKAGLRELARVVGAATTYTLHHQTVQALLERYFFRRYPEFTDRLPYPIPADPSARRVEMVKLRVAGWTANLQEHDRSFRLFDIPGSAPAQVLTFCRADENESTQVPVCSV